VANIIFTLDAETFTFSRGRSYTLDDPATVGVVVDYSDGGQLYAYDKGIEEQFFNLAFDGLTDTDAANVAGWVSNVCVGPKNPFIYTDEDSVDYTVRCLDVKTPLKKVKHNYWTGTIHLREEIS